MTRYQQARLNSYRSVAGVFDRYPDEVASVPALARNVAAFRGQLAALEEAAGAQSDYAPQTGTKEALRQRLAGASVPVAQALAARADEGGDPATADQFDLSATDFLHESEQDALDRAGTTLAAAREAGDALAEYGASAEDVDALEAAHEAFFEALPSARDEIVARRRHTAAIERLVPEIGQLLRKRLDRMMTRFGGGPFGDEYQTARTVVDPPRGAGEG